MQSREDTGQAGQGDVAVTCWLRISPTGKWLASRKGENEERWVHGILKGDVKPEVAGKLIKVRDEAKGGT